MKIAYLINNGIDFYQQNSPLLRVESIINALRKWDHHVSLVALDKRRVIFTDEWNIYHSARLGISGTKPFNQLESGLRYVQGILHLPYLAVIDGIRFYDAGVNNLANYEVLHERHTLFGWAGLLASKKLGLPLLLDVEADPIKELDYCNTPLRGIQKIFASSLFRNTLLGATAIDVVSQELKDQLIKKWGIPSQKIFVLPNGVDIDNFNPDICNNRLRKKLEITDEIVITFVGSFYPWHGVGLLVEAFNKVINQIANVRLVLIGDGIMMSTIMDKISNYKLNHSIILTGQIDHKEVPSYLSISDICVAPYLGMNSQLWFSPMKILEYMAAGKAVIASGSGQVVDIIQNNLTGLLVEPGNLEDLTQALIELIKDPEKRANLGGYARQHVVDQYSWDKYVIKLEELYNRVKGR